MPFYRGRLDADRWQDLPRLTRRDIQDAGGALRSRRVPRRHGDVYIAQSTGSTGEPVKVAGTGLMQVYWRAITLRDHRWHGRDLSLKLCSIRPSPAHTREGWGPATDVLGGTGQLAMLPLGTDVSEQARWLVRHDPEYLLSFPSNILALTEHFAEHGLSLPALREVRTVGEMVHAELRERVRSAWNVPVTDLYSSQELGVIALQCPSGSGLYHVQSESVLVEILDDAGAPCAPGAIGRVVVTALHNLAMPLIRYEIGDYAEAGPPCPCGRGLPTLARIVGRQRNMLVLPDGERRWPLSGFRAFREIAPIRRYQLAQLDPEHLELRLVADRPLTRAEEQRLAAVVCDALGHDFSVRCTYRNQLLPSEGGKFEDFVSMARVHEHP